MDRNLQLEREQMDKKVIQERATVDRVIKQEREKMYQNFKYVYEEIEKKVKLEREEMDLKVKLDRAAMDRTLKQQQDKMEKQFKKIHKDMDQKLEQDRDNMDHSIELQRAKMDCTNLQARADMDQMLQHEREAMDANTLLEQVRMEAKVMQDHARIDPEANEMQFHVPPPEQSDSDPPYVIVMEFTVYRDNYLSDIPNGFYEFPGSIRIIEPGKVEWYLMVENLVPLGYERNADLYYIEPGCVPPDGMVIMSGQEHVEQMMQALKGKKKCDLYIVRNGPPSDDNYNYDGMGEEDQINEDSWGEATDRGEWDMDEHHHGQSNLN